MSELTPEKTSESVSDKPKGASGTGSIKKFAALGLGAVIVLGGSFLLYKTDPSHARKAHATGAVAQSAPAKPIVAPISAPVAAPVPILPVTAAAVPAKTEAATAQISTAAAAKPAVQNIAPANSAEKPASTDAKPAGDAQAAADKAPALTISDMEIEPVDALEHGTYKVSGKIVNPDAKKKIELTAIHALLKDKNGATVQDVPLDLPAKRIMAPGEVRDFSYTVTAKDPSIVRLEVAVDLLR